MSILIQHIQPMLSLQELARMEQIFTIVAFLSLFSFSQAQCTGILTNSTLYVSVSWTATSSNTVSFSFTAPANTSLYTALAVSENIIVTPFQFVSCGCTKYYFSVYTYRIMLMQCMQGTMELLILSKTGIKEN